MITHADFDYKTLFAFFFLQTTTVTLIKASLLLLYWRTFTLKGFRYAIYVVSAIICANAVESILGFLLQCLPVPKFWNHTLPGHCINQKLFITLASVLYMITDLIIYVMPMPIIWQLHMTKRRKVELSIVFLLGGLCVDSSSPDQCISVADTSSSVCLTGIARIYYTNLLDVKNITYTNANPAIWNIVESQVGFVAANVPSMGPLFGKAGSVVKKIRHNYASQSFEHGMHTSTKYTVSRRGSTDGFKRMMDDDVVGVESIAKPGSIFADGDFAESIPMNEIVVKTNVEQTHKSRPSLEAI